MIPSPDNASSDGEDTDSWAVVSRLVSGLEQYEDDVDAIEWHLRQLTSLVPYHCNNIVATGAVQQVIYVMKCHEAYEQLMEVAVRFLAELFLHASEDSSCAQILLDNDGIDLILSLMKCFGHNTHVQASGGRILAVTLMANDHSRDFVIEKGGIAAIVQAMSRLSGSDDRDFQLLVCNAIQYNLQTDSSGRITEMFEKAGGIQVLVSLLRRFRHNSPSNLLHSVCGVIAFLSDECEPVKSTFVSIGGASVLIQAMEDCMADRNFQLAALCAIRQLSSGNGSDGIIKAFEDAGIVSTITAVMNQDSNDETVVTGAILTLGCLAMNHYAVADTIMRAGGFSTLVNAMSRHSNNANLQRTACAAIGACALQNDSVYLKSAVQSTPKLVSSIVTAMRQHPANEELQFVATLTLQDLVANVDLGRKIVNGGGLPVLVATMRHFPFNVGLQDAIVSIVGTISSTEDDDTMESIKSCGFVAVLASSIARLSNQNAFFRKAILALCSIMSHSSCDVQQEIVAVGGIPLLDFILKSIENCAVLEAALLIKNGDESGENSPTDDKATSSALDEPMME